MGFVRFSIATAIMVGLTAFLVQRFSPNTVDNVLSDPTVQQLTIKVDNLVQQATHKINETGYPLYIKAIKVMKPFLDYVKTQLDIGQKKSGGKTSPSKPAGKVQLKKADSNAEQQQKRKKKGNNAVKVLTVEELKRYDGSAGSKGLYLAVMGQVFDVKKGKEHYGPGGGYEFFSGRDASRAFVSGNFEEEGLTDDIKGLSYQDYIGLKDWIDFYFKDYTYVGKLAGRYYQPDGQETEYKLQADRWLADALHEKELESNDKKLFPPCNSEWSAERGTRVWCTKRSGGVDRSWVGVPRELFSPGKPKPRCACVKDFGSPTSGAVQPKQGQQQPARGDLDHPNLKEYPGCHPKEPSCELPPDDN